MSVIRRNIGRQRAWQGSWIGEFCKIDIHDVNHLCLGDDLRGVVLLVAGGLLPVLGNLLPPTPLARQLVRVLSRRILTF